MAIDKSWFLEWRTPEAFYRRVEAGRRALGEELIWGRYKWLREAWIAAQLAWVLESQNTVCVRSEEEEDAPDFWLRAHCRELPFEAVYCDHPERRIAEEYRFGTPQPQRDPFSAEYLRIAKQRLRDIVAQKDAKNYSPPRHLAVYFNFEFYRDLPIPDAELQALTRPSGTGLVEVWIVTPSRVIRTWPKWSWLVREPLVRP